MVGTAQLGGGVSIAQTPPSERELRIYAGLHDAAARGDAAEIEQLIGLDAQRYDIATIAAVNNDLEMLKIALAGSGDARAITGPYHDTALIAAAHRGHVDIVRTLIAAKAPLNHVNDLGRTALLEAVVLGNGGRDHTATVEALVEAGADVTLPDRHGTTALQHARTRGYSQIARILERAGAH